MLALELDEKESVKDYGDEPNSVCKTIDSYLPIQ
jgi:hypothetical protein